MCGDHGKAKTGWTIACGARMPEACAAAAAARSVRRAKSSLATNLREPEHAGGVDVRQGCAGRRRGCSPEAHGGCALPDERDRTDPNVRRTSCRAHMLPRR